MILPSEAHSSRHPWSRDHLRLHRHLLRRPTLLPRGASLLLAVSGGQDSMALAALLQDLQPLHEWQLRLWHGDHGWRAEASRQAEELTAWARSRDLPLERQSHGPAEGEGLRSEEAARRWRYACLERAALHHGCDRIVTGHTASDRAETVLLNLARGCHRRGLSSLRAIRPLRASGPGERGGGASGPGDCGGLRLVRPLLIFSRSDTARFCRESQLPVWLDSSNEDLRFHRNRLRAEVLPVLEELHPGACHRISSQAERLAEEEDQIDELVSLALAALAALAAPGEATAAGIAGIGGQRPPHAPIEALRRRELVMLSRASQRRLVQHWITAGTGRGLAAEQVDDLLVRLAPERGSGSRHLEGGWRLHWDRCIMKLVPPQQEHG